MSSGSGGVLVRGSCPAGHVTETRSDKGRVTWEGECAEPGCTEKVKARRAPKDRVPPPLEPGEQTGSVTVVRINDYDQTGTGAQDDPGGPQVADTPPAELEPHGGDGPDAGGPADPIDEHGEPATAWSRFRERRRATRSARRRPTVYRHPLVR